MSNEHTDANKLSTIGPDGLPIPDPATAFSTATGDLPDPELVAAIHRGLDDRYGFTTLPTGGVKAPDSQDGAE